MILRPLLRLFQYPWLQSLFLSNAMSSCRIPTQDKKRRIMNGSELSKKSVLGRLELPTSRYRKVTVGRASLEFR